MSIPSRERVITVGKTCSDCPEGGRCPDCQDSIDTAVRRTLAAGTDPRHINVKD